MWSKNKDLISANEINPSRTIPSKFYCYLNFAAITPISTKMKHVLCDDLINTHQSSLKSVISFWLTQGLYLVKKMS